MDSQRFIKVLVPAVLLGTPFPLHIVSLSRATPVSFDLPTYYNAYNNKNKRSNAKSIVERR